MALISRLILEVTLVELSLMSVQYLLSPPPQDPDVSAPALLSWLFTFSIPKACRVSVWDYMRRREERVMRTCPSWLVTVSLGLGKVWGQLESSADVEVVSTISPGWKTPRQPTLSRARVSANIYILRQEETLYFCIKFISPN